MTAQTTVVRSESIPERPGRALWPPPRVAVAKLGPSKSLESGSENGLRERDEDFRGCSLYVHQEGYDRCCDHHSPVEDRFEKGDPPTAEAGQQIDCPARDQSHP